MVLSDGFLIKLRTQREFLKTFQDTIWPNYKTDLTGFEKM